MTIWQGYWREDSVTIWLQLTFEICSFELSLLASHKSPMSWVSGTCKAWGCGLQIKEVFWWFSLRQRKHLVGSPWSYVMVKGWLWESPRKQTFGCSEAAQGCFLECPVPVTPPLESILRTYMQNIVESVFTVLAFISLFVLFFLGSWEMELPPCENYLHWLGWGICLNLRVQWYLLHSWMCLCYKEWNQGSVLWSLGVGKTELGLRSNSEMDRVSKETMQKASYLCSLCLYLMHLFFKHLLPSHVVGTWDVEIIQPFCHLSNNSF